MKTRSTCMALAILALTTTGVLATSLGTDALAGEGSHPAEGPYLRLLGKGEQTHGSQAVHIIMTGRALEKLYIKMNHNVTFDDLCAFIGDIKGKPKHLVLPLISYSPTQSVTERRLPNISVKVFESDLEKNVHTLDSLRIQHDEVSKSLEQLEKRYEEEMARMAASMAEEKARFMARKMELEKALAAAEAEHAALAAGSH